MPASICRQSLSGLNVVLALVKLAFGGSLRIFTIDLGL